MSEGAVITEEWVERSNDGSFEDGGRGYESRNVSGLQKLAKARKWIFPYSLQKGMQPGCHLDFSPERPVNRLLTQRTIKDNTFVLVQATKFV